MAYMLMDIQKINGIVGTIKRIADNDNITIGYKISRIRALIGTLQIDLRLLNVTNETQETEPTTLCD